MSEEGYITDVTPVKISRNNNKYFNGKLQTEHKNYNFVCFASEKVADYQTALRMNSPVKLSNIKFTPSVVDKETLNIQITKKSSMQVIRKLNFQKKLEIASDKSASKSEKQSVSTLISDVDTKSTHVVLSIK